MRNKVISGNTLAKTALASLGDRLPPSWRHQVIRGGAGGGRFADAVLRLASPDGSQATLAVAAKPRVEPRDVETLRERFREWRGVTPVVAAPFLTPRTRERLREAGVAYVDLTGNAWLTLDRPALWIETTGADRGPWPEGRPARTLRGAKAGRVVRALLDLRPPLGVRRLAALAGADPGYVSRVLALLEREALVERKRRGPVTEVDWAGLIRRWAEDHSLLGSNTVASYLDPRGLAALTEKLLRSSVRYALTGSLAASQVAPVAPPRLAALYVDDPEGVAKRLELRPAEAGANVLLVAPFDPVVYERTWEREGLTFAALSQVTVDLLTSPGRGPAEAEELLAWMAGNEDAWRT